tara:strand:+ start:191 stop:1477 length:1287 start_codon:yes stop_codon:yes gene_type:complete
LRYFSTKNKISFSNFRDVLFKGIADDNGLYIPESIPRFDKSFFEAKMNYPEIAFEMMKPFVGGVFNKSELSEITNSAYSFETTLTSLNNNLHIMELFHGPTFAFKDYAVRFMAKCMERLLDKEITLLVATSGDTGSAVANGFLGLKGIRVVILYPSGRVSEIQEKQLTTYGKNVTALEVLGSFDNCQKMVKKAFLDNSLKSRLNLTSANSINIVRLLPQSIYYAWAWKQLNPKNTPVVFSIPCGNLGNITGGVLAKQMGLPIKKLIASTNANNVFPNFLKNGEFYPKSSIRTISNAMDVGSPNNINRIISLYQNNINKIRKDLMSWSFSDNSTRKEIKKIKLNEDYIVDPHTAVGLLGIEKYNSSQKNKDIKIVIATAHPAKFCDIVEPIIKEKIKLPNELQKSMKKQKNSIIIPANYLSLKEFLIKS